MLVKTKTKQPTVTTIRNKFLTHDFNSGNVQSSRLSLGGSAVSAAFILAGYSGELTAREAPFAAHANRAMRARPFPGRPWALPIEANRILGNRCAD
jgi:hypothetical protein